MCQLTNNDSTDNSIVYNNHGGTDRPTREVLTRARAIAHKMQRKHVGVGMRVKVRFEDNVWYGGVISGVANQGRQIKINLHGTDEVSDFPGNDIVVDAQNNGRHLTDAQVFLPPSSSSNGKSDGKLEEEKSSTEDSSASNTSRNNNANFQETNRNNHHDDSDDDELGAFIYNSSLAAKSIAEANR